MSGIYRQNYDSIASETKSLHVRPVRQSDQRALNHLIRFGSHVHRHLDWCEPTEWIDHQPYFVAHRNYKLVAGLACPPDPENIAWIRLFGVLAEVSIWDAWSLLWDAVIGQAKNLNLILAAIPIQPWFQKILLSTGFEKINDVITLAWDRPFLPPDIGGSAYEIRRMNTEDLPAVTRIDRLAFGLIWQNSESLLEIARSLSAIATVAETSGRIVGYQISTANSSGGHLARLAILPDWQGRGVGRALVQNLLHKFHLWGTLRVTVNTQADNTASLALYKKAGFQQTDEIYPVFQMSFKS